MKITELAHKYNLSRSTLLYYDRIGLLKPSARSAAGYRLYSEDDATQLSRICAYRQAGLTITDIQHLLTNNPDSPPGLDILERRLKELQKTTRELQGRQTTLCSLIHSLSGKAHPVLTKEKWVDILRNIGMTDQDMMAWHTEFEQMAPFAHQEFLQWLGIAPAEIKQIRRLSK